VFSSFVFDFQLRNRLAGVNLSEFIVAECALPKMRDSAVTALRRASMNLAFSATRWAPEWLRERHDSDSWHQRLAVTPHERLRLRAQVDAVVAELYGLDEAGIGWILRDCDHPVERVCNQPFARTLDPKGFWRVEKERAPELRHSVLTLIAFRDLQQMITSNGGDNSAGISAFVNQNEGEGWMLPQALRLADYDLGHDERARAYQPVASCLGPRFLPWQLEMSSEQSWSECERHARNLLGPEGYARLKTEIAQAGPGARRPSTPTEADVVNAGRGQRRLFPGERSLFGDKTEDPI
jgi:hypothetical protein